MTILIVSFKPDEILFCSDTFRYYLKPDTVKDVLEHRLEITHANFKDHIEKIETDNPKIHQINKNVGLICGGDGFFNNIIEDLDAKKNIPKQIKKKLEQKKCDHSAFWSCHVGRFAKGKCELTSIVYKNGIIETEEHAGDHVSFDSFAPEMAKLFFSKHVSQFYISDTNEKIKILTRYFKEIAELYNDLAGKTPIKAKIDSEGFKWIQN